MTVALLVGVPPHTFSQPTPEPLALWPEEKTPPTLIVHNEDDLGFLPGSRIYHQALDASNVPNEFLLFQKGGHGYGLRSREDAGAWPERAKEWLIKTGVL
jgi:acetyl esterase/lipase